MREEKGLSHKLKALPEHPSVHMSETDVPYQADCSAGCGQMSGGQGEHGCQEAPKRFDAFIFHARLLRHLK